MTPPLRLLVSLLLLTSLGCPTTGQDDDDAATDDDDAASDDDDATPAGPLPFPLTLGEAANRPAELTGPVNWDQAEPLPLVILLHGFGANSSLQDLLLRYSAQIEPLQYLLLLPEGTENANGQQFWNAMPACCDGGNTGVDDVGYLSGLVDEAIERANVDTSRIYFSGHSNGGFMSFRMACEFPDRIAGIAPLAGATYLDPADCAVGDGVHVLAVHGELDGQGDGPRVHYEGVPGSYPSAPDAAERWAGRGGCATPGQDGNRYDFINSLDGDETRSLVFDDCDKDVELWTIEDTGHVPLVNDDYAFTVLNWLFARSL
ncbi:MAG: hypothetical protein KDA24_17875 [Deltaproteobacteria bacterium]|nr:hypothetical protein [Deltaproteobacteria bacterium]